MKRTAKKVSVIGFVLIALLVILFHMGTKIDRNPRLDGYDDYYLCRYDYQALALMGFPGMPPDSYSRVWFLPFQKAKLLAQIKEDIHGVMTDVQTAYDTAVFAYEISDDFRKVVVSVDDYDTYMRLRYDYANPDETNLFDEIEQRVVLYHDLTGSDDTPYIGDIVDIRYTGTEEEKNSWQ